MSTPFDSAGVTRGRDGIKRYDGLPSSLVHMLRDTVTRHPDREALAETGGGPRLTYRELWDRAARVAGGLSGPAWPVATGWPCGWATGSASPRPPA
jgi:hypothetical protein